MCENKCVKSYQVSSIFKKSDFFNFEFVVNLYVRKMEKDLSDKVQHSKRDGDAMKVLEDALTLCKFGKFHALLLAASFCSILTATLVTTTSSYILPVAECDLKMNIMYKGLLNAIPFLGQIVSSPFTGFLVDTFGRKIFLIGGNVSIFISTLLEGSSQTYWMMLFIKLIEGIALSFSFSAVLSMLSEFTPFHLRDRVLLIYAGFVSNALIVASLLAWASLPLPIHVVVWEGYFELHSWNVFLYICSLWSFLASVLYYCLPESPKFLLSHAREEEALEVLKMVYSMNTGNDRDTFPIVSFNTSGVLKPTDVISLKKQLVNAFVEVKELFRKPLVYRLLLLSCLGFAGLLVFTSLRLWYPQISTIVEHYSKNHDETAQFCVMIADYMDGLKEVQLNVLPVDNITDPSICVPKLSGNQTYINGIILGVVSLVFVITSAVLVEYIGQKILMLVFLLLCAVCSTSLYWTNQSIQIAILISATSGLLQTALSLKQNICVRVFPTTLRVLACSIVFTVGRIGSLVGNIVFPILLSLGCMAPFLTISGISLGMMGLVYFLPDVNKENKATGDK